jgi:hypothetical protein
VSKKAVVCVHVLPSLDYVEIVQLDPRHQSNIDKATALPGAFDQNTRQIPSVDALGQVIRDLYDSCRIPLNTPTVLVLPSFFTRETDVVPDMGHEEIQMSLTAEAERFYIFKKNEPQIDWVKLTEHQLIYTAFPRTEIDKYVEIFQSHKIPLLAIELNYFSILRGLVASGAIMDEITRRQTWCLLIIADYTFFSATCEGGKILKTVEAPLSIGVNDELAAISEIKQDFERFLAQQPLTKLIIVNNSERIATDVLVSRLDIQEQVLVIEQNGSTLRSRGEINAMYPCTLEAIGGSLYFKFPELPTANLLPDSLNNTAAIMEIQDWMTKILIGVNALALLVCLAIWGLLSLFVLSKEGDLASVVQKMGSLQQGQSSAEVVRKRFIKNGIDQNHLINKMMVKVGVVVPHELWIDQYVLAFPRNDQQLGADIRGGALSPDMVERFHNELKRVTQVDDLEVASVNLSNAPDEVTHYNWVIRTKSVPLDVTEMIQN